jgi:hypothetical protein
MSTHSYIIGNNEPVIISSQKGKDVIDERGFYAIYE